MAVNVKVDGTTYEGINTITTGGKTLELKGGGGVEPKDWQDYYIEPREYYAANRPATWPKIPLPSEMMDVSSEYYEAGDCAYFFYKKLDTDIFLTDAIRFEGTNISATLYKYNDTTLVSSSAVTPTVSGSITDVEFELTSADADWNDYNSVILKVTADAVTTFNYATIQRKINGLPLANSAYYVSSLVEISMMYRQAFTKGFVFGSSSYGSALSNLIFASFALPESVTTQYMFIGAKKLKAIIEALNTSAVTVMSNMFSGCTSLQTIPAFNTSAVTNISSMFDNCASLQTIPELDTSAVTDMSSMFNNCASLQTIPSLNTSAVTNMSRMFYGCRSLQTIPELDTSAVTDMSNMFNGCTALQTISSLDTSAVTNMNNMFVSCSSLQTVPTLDTSAVADMSNMFNSCSSLKSIDLSKWNFTSTSRTSSMFSNCNALNKVIIREFGAGTVIYATPFASAHHITGTRNAIYNPDGLKDGYIYVPDDMVETIKAATNWSTYASQIKGLSELPAA